MFNPNPLPRMHELKTWPVYWEAVASGEKTFELRFNDRGYCKGDFLNLQEWDPQTESYTGRRLVVEVTYLLSSQAVQAWIAPGWVAMSIRLRPELT